MPGYFGTFQAAVLRGREFATSDDEKGERVTVVNESFARQYLAGADPIGHRLKRGRADSMAPWLTIVGVVPDMEMQGIGNNEQSGAGFYIPIAQSEIGGFVSIAVRVRDTQRR